jgi:hypothetical protein
VADQTSPASHRLDLIKALHGFTYALSVFCSRCERLPYGSAELLEQVWKPASPSSMPLFAPCKICKTELPINLEIYHPTRQHPELALLRPPRELLDEVLRLAAVRGDDYQAIWRHLHHHQIIFWFGSLPGAFRALDRYIEWAPAPIAWHSFAAPFLPLLSNEMIADAVGDTVEAVADLRTHLRIPLATA